MNQNILIKGEPQKSKSALIVTIIGVLLILASFYVAIYVYLKGYPRYVWDVPYRRIYYHSFVNFYIESFCLQLLWLDANNRCAYSDCWHYYETLHREV